MIPHEVFLMSPTDQEVEEELERILQSKAFATHGVSRALLERLVNDSLSGKVGGENYEHTLGMELFRKPADWARDLDSAVRQAMSNLRKHLLAYYGTEGSGDKVEISFPKRSGFAARFAYRQVSNPEEAVQRLSDAFRYEFPDLERCTRIVLDLEACMGEHPSYAPGHAVLAEAILACVMCDANAAFTMPQALMRADEAAKTGLGLNKGLWRLHVVTGAIHCCRFEWDKADAAYKVALELARHETVAHFWYVAFLVAVGRITEAEECVEEAEHSEAFRRETPWVQIAPFTRSLFLYIKREFIHTTLALPPEIIMNKNLTGQFPLQYRWPAELLMACAGFAYEDIREMPMDAETATKTSISYLKGVESAVLKSKVGAFSGLIVLLCMRAAKWHNGQEERATTLLMEMESRAESPISLALAYMGVGRSEDAIAQLERACEIGHPLVVWLHLWPVFDPLHESERFKALIEKMHLPQREVREG
jgi:tetratricopeptide (TPR) repeat protein